MRATRRVRVYPHNDLQNAAFYHLSVIRKKVSESNHDALCLDAMSCLTSLAFSNEALVNFVGHKRINAWKESDFFSEKAKIICTRAGHTFNKKIEPFKTIWELKKIRDSMAYGKPIEFDSNANSRETVIEEMQYPWDKYLNHEYVEHAFSQTKCFESLLFEGCKISVKDTITCSLVGLP